MPDHTIERRKVLKLTGAGIAGSMALIGSASANGRYGNGNGIGAFLNEEAVLKDRPIWDSGMANKTGQAEVEILVGTLTSVDVPQDLLPPGMEAPEQLPVAFTPRAVKISPGTEVTWTWVSDHHSVTSFNESADAPEDHGQVFDDHGDAGHTFSYTFDEVDTYLYFCHPHGTPYPIPFGPLDPVPNHTGMRGAVLVAGK